MVFHGLLTDHQTCRNLPICRPCFQFAQYFTLAWRQSFGGIPIYLFPRRQLSKFLENARSILWLDGYLSMFEAAQIRQQARGGDALGEITDGPMSDRNASSWLFIAASLPLSLVLVLHACKRSNDPPQIAAE